MKLNIDTYIRTYISIYVHTYVCVSTYVHTYNLHTRARTNAHEHKLQFSTVTRVMVLVYAGVTLHGLVNLNLSMFCEIFLQLKQFCQLYGNFQLENNFV